MLKYQAIANDIRSSIEDGTLKPNDRLPTVVELCDLYGVSKITIKRAYDLLTEQGFIASKRGDGTYVKNTDDFSSDPLFFEQSDRAQGFTKGHQAEGKTTSIVYDFRIELPPKEIAHHLMMQPDEYTYYHCRSRLLDGTPLVIEYTYMPLNLVPGLKKEHLYGSVFDYLQDTLGLRISSFHRIFRAVPATQEEAERLQVKEGDPLFETEHVGFLSDGRPFEYSLTRHVGALYQLRNVNVL